jgi:hypothetical protein
MGTSKITLISGVYIILGLYTLSFNTADEATSKIAYTAGNKAQAEQLARTGVYLAQLKLYNYSPSTWYQYPYTYFGTQNRSTMGGSVSYSAAIQPSLASNERQIVATGTIGTTQVTAKVIVQYDKGRWRTVRSYYN